MVENRSNRRGAVAAYVLLASLVVVGGILGSWKSMSIRAANAAAAKQPEPVEAVTTALARAYDYRGSASSIGTVLALRSVTLRNELAGTVRRAALAPGSVVEPGALLVAL